MTLRKIRIVKNRRIKIYSNLFDINKGDAVDISYLDSSRVISSLHTLDYKGIEQSI